MHRGSKGTEIVRCKATEKGVFSGGAQRGKLRASPELSVDAPEKGSQWSADPTTSFQWLVHVAGTEFI